MTSVVGGCSINELGNGDICGLGAIHQSVSSIIDPASTDTLTAAFATASAIGANAVAAAPA